MSTKIFPMTGGIYPPENKSYSNSTPISVACLPSHLILPLTQPFGETAKLCVEPHQRVLKGEQIAVGQGALGTPIHAPTSGTIVEVSERPLQHGVSHVNGLAIIIEPDGLEQWCALSGIQNYQSETPDVLVRRIYEAGIIGMGGAGFPTPIKLNLDRTIETLIINGVECEPYITADDRLMREHAAKIIAGTHILSHILQCDNILIGIEDNKPEAIAAMMSASQNTSIKVITIPTKYPSGGEKQLIKILTGKEVPSGGLPADIGIACQNVATAAAIYDGIVLGKPVISRITTVTGHAAKQPGNYETLIGTPINHLLKLADVNFSELSSLIMGGPMMGVTLKSTEIPITKVSNCLLAAKHDEMLISAVEQPCIRCGICTDACPVELLPQQLYWFSKSDQFEQAQAYNINDCIECGACAYVCPSHIPLVQYYRYAKSEIRRKENEQKKAEYSRQRFDQRNARLAQAAAEKEAKRKARALAASAKQNERLNNPIDQNIDLTHLKTEAATRLKRWSDAEKALSVAKSQGSDNLEALQVKVDKLKQVAEAAQEKWRASSKAASIEKHSVHQ